jgi:hypothetical protein
MLNSSGSCGSRFGSRESYGLFAALSTRHGDTVNDRRFSNRSHAQSNRSRPRARRQIPEIGKSAAQTFGQNGPARPPNPQSLLIIGECFPGRLCGDPPRLPHPMLRVSGISFLRRAPRRHPPRHHSGWKRPSGRPYPAAAARLGIEGPFTSWNAALRLTKPSADHVNVSLEERLLP